MDEIFKRGTCRHFKELTPVAKEDLLTLVKAGMQARACGNQEAREFIIVTRDDLVKAISHNSLCLLYTSPSPRDGLLSRMPSSA